MTFFVEALLSAAASKAWEERKTIQAVFSDSISAATSGKLRVFVFGCGGTGKTTLGQIMSGERDFSEIGGAYELSSDIEHYGIKGKYFSSISIPPGQEIYRAKDWGTLFKSFRKSRRPLIINVVNWGFHSIERDELARIPEFSKYGVTEETKIEFLKNNRKEEIKALSTLLNGLAHYDRQFDLITLVAKQDLWWSKREEVRKHYENKRKGSYMSKIIDLQNSIGAQNFKHHLTSAAFCHLNLRTADGVEVFQIEPAYDNRLMYANLANFNSLIESKIL